MAWLIVVAIVVVFLVFMAGYRKSALALVVAALIGGVALYQYNERRQQRATTRIAASEIAVENIAFRPTYRSSYDASGTIRNNSETYTLDGIRLEVTMRDCRGKDKSTCVVIGKAATYAAVTVPPHEVRDFTASLYFGSDRVKPKGTLAWDYEITPVTAKRQ